MTEYITRCLKCKLVYRPELARPFSRDKPPDEYCPQCGANLDLVGEQTAENRRK